MLNFFDEYPMAHAMFKPYRISDHSPAILNIPLNLPKRYHPFKFVNFVVDKKEFLPSVKEVWERDVKGGFMFKVTQKLGMLKKPCRRLYYMYNCSGKRLHDLRRLLDEKQVELDGDPFNYVIREDHTRRLTEYLEVFEDEEKILLQKSKINWLKEGDRNSKFFHKIVN